MAGIVITNSTIKLPFSSLFKGTHFSGFRSSIPHLSCPAFHRNTVFCHQYTWLRAACQTSRKQKTKPGRGRCAARVLRLFFLLGSAMYCVSAPTICNPRAAARCACSLPSICTCRNSTRQRRTPDSSRAAGQQCNKRLPKIT